MRILQSKLQPPKRPGVLHRERLTRLFAPISHTTLFTVVAGAGFGKTTLVTDALSRLDLNSAWYRLDQQDTDFHVFMSYLYGMIPSVLSGDKGSGRKRTVSISGIQSPEDILIDWIGCLEDQIRTSFAIVLDDYHLVQGNDTINRAVALILRYLPSHIHLVIVGRKSLPLALSRFRAQGRLQEISEQELTFSHEEIKAFFRGQPGLTPTQIDQISGITGGWAASLVLLRYTLEKIAPQGVPDHLRRIEKQPAHYIFSYLKENIFDVQPAPIRDFMMKAALLPEIEIRLCEKIFSLDNAREILNRMLEDHLLIFPVDDSGQVFYLHHLFRDFLLAELHRTYPASQIRALHCRIGKAADPSDAGQALYHYIAGRDYDRAVSVILEHEMQFLLQGKVRFLGRQIEKLPDTCIRQHPRLLLSLARLHSHYGEPEKAIDLISKALTLFRHRDNREQMVSCVIELASQYYYTGHIAEAMQLMEQVLDDIDSGSQTYILTMTFLTFLPSVLGKFNTAQTYDKTAREVISGYPEFEKKIATALLDTSRVHTLYFKGEFEASQILCRQLLERVKTMAIEPCLPLVYFQLSANSYYLGKYKQGCAFAQEGICACERMALSDSRKGWVYFAWALNRLGLHHLDEVSDTLAAATPLFEQPGNRWGLASVLDCQAQALRARRNTTRAKKMLDKALALIQGYGLTITRGILNNTYAAVLIDEGEYRAGLTRLSEAEKDLKGADFHLFNTDLLTARALYQMGSIDPATKRLAQALTLAMTHDYDRFLVKEETWIIPLLGRAKNTAFRSPGPPLRSYLEQLLEKELNRSPKVLTIGLLGPFTLGVAGRPIPGSAFKSAKALMILKYLAARRSRGYVHRERLMELLWPDGDPEKTAARFNMAMSALRKALEPRLAPKAPSTYIDRKKDSYRLFGDQRVAIDTERFSSLLAKSKDEQRNACRLSVTLDALRLYRGDFLEEDPYEDWCMEIREAFLRDYISALESVIHIFEQQQETSKALAWAEQLFQADPLSETAVQKLMTLYAGSGDRSSARTAFDRHARAARRYGLPVSQTLLSFKNNLSGI